MQAFEPSVRDGERSLIYLGGRYSHAVRKVPAAGDFRVQTRYGAGNLPRQATSAEQVVAQAAMEIVTSTVSSNLGDPLLYARVDLVGSAGAPVLMELELIEPELFLPMAPGSADRLADSIVASPLTPRR